MNFWERTCCSGCATSSRGRPLSRATVQAPRGWTTHMSHAHNELRRPVSHRITKPPAPSACAGERWSQVYCFRDTLHFRLQSKSLRVPLLCSRDHVWPIRRIPSIRGDSGEILTHVPVAEWNEALDPSSVHVDRSTQISGRVAERGGAVPLHRVRSDCEHPNPWLHPSIVGAKGHPRMAVSAANLVRVPP
jgi:hypothetical protein